MGMLKGKTPEDDTMEVPDGATILQVLEALEIPPDSVQVFTVNGQLERDRGRKLSPGDELTVLPPVGGG